MTQAKVQGHRVLALILARGGSKRLPGKNIKPLAGKPMIGWTIESAMASPSVAMTVVSTDCSAIAEVSKRFGAEVPFMRPDSLAGDAATSADAALHALDALEGAGVAPFDTLVLLEPTSPLRAVGDIDGVVQMLADHWDEADAVVTVGKVHLEQPNVMKLRDEQGRLRPLIEGPEAQGTAWFPYGVAYAVKVDVLRRLKTFYPARVLGYPLQRWQNYEVDDQFDFFCVEAVMKHLKEQVQ